MTGLPAGRLASDFFDSERMLSDEERQVRDLTREFVDREVIPHAGERWLAGEFPVALARRMGELGLLGANLPEAYGCAGLGEVSYGLIMQELERGDSGVRSFASVQGALVMYPIYEYGTQDQKHRWLPALASGEAIGCFGLTEPDAGSDPGAMRTRARRTSSGWVIDGTKAWITNGSIADVAVVWAKDDDGAIRGFLIERGTKGFSTSEVATKASMRASVTSSLHLEGVEVGPEHVLPGAAGLQAALRCLTQARYGIAWGAIGAAAACFEEALAHAAGRVAFGSPIAAYQIIQERLAGMASKLARMRLVALQIGRLKEAGALRYQQVSLAKRDNVRAALEIARDARTILGASGITVEYHSIRHALNLESVDTYEGTYDIQTLIVGRDLTGLDAFGLPAAT